MIKPDHPQRRDMERIYGSISPFELKDTLISFANENATAHAQTMLNAGRGNPNWISTEPREAFFALGQFAIEECKRVHYVDPGLAGLPERQGSYDRFRTYAAKHRYTAGIDFLEAVIAYGVKTHNMRPDDWVYELVDGIIGGHYPYPDRMLPQIEKVVYDFLCQELYGGTSLQGHARIYAVEGATAAMCYIFDSLIANQLLESGDTIAIMVPIFTPYLEIPHLPQYHFKIKYIIASGTNADGSHSWQYPDSEIEKLKDTSIKALFCVNPSNPPSVAVKPCTVNKLVQIIHNHHPNLMIIMDDVYCTFVDQFRSIMTDIPRNSIGVYSFSKYYGVTGWRLGVIVVHDNNVFDELIRSLPTAKRDVIQSRYSALTTHPEKITFIDRIVADSRQVALNHTAGLSTPQQVQMALFAIAGLLDKQNTYKDLTKSICRRRKAMLYEGLDMDVVHNAYDASYYTEFDLLVWARRHCGEDFANYLQENFEPVDILFRLAEESSIVLLNGGGFHGPAWSIRISLANLNDEAYLQIGRAIRHILHDYVNQWHSTQNKT
ncbi:aspartate 4-decarboxylase [Paenibacillus sp. ACRRX]|uniref:aspartate 4-decarboxylase n=1 Tax=Paenibacillus sp. ACRRX TaxID=2918206 RepID=UPI001EF42446|nr:aspartate 4-decarboxylase [Paenibacillus sp. ACRRX]MCG7409905.1 aspartate 4-decarboxylase [Paenibacillus sp. ACRRX]